MVAFGFGFFMWPSSEATLASLIEILRSKMEIRAKQSV